MAVLGTSQERGIVHTIMDLVFPGSDFFKEAQHHVPKKGTAIKCWGWFDFLHGGLRVSYQDWRLLDRPKDDSDYRQRLAQLMREGADLIVLTSSSHLGENAEWLVSFYRENAQLVQRWSGTIVFLGAMVSPGGPLADMVNQGYSARGNRWPFGKLRDDLVAQLTVLEATIPGVKEKTLVWDINPMINSVITWQSESVFLKGPKVELPWAASDSKTLKFHTKRDCQGRAGRIHNVYPHRGCYYCSKNAFMEKPEK